MRFINSAFLAIILSGILLLNANAAVAQAQDGKAAKRPPEYGPTSPHSLMAVASRKDPGVIAATSPNPSKARWWLKRHKKKVTQAAQGRAEFVMIGDSLVHNFEKKGMRIWTLFYGRYQPLNLGFNRDATENAIWRIENGELDGISPKLIVIMIGTNNGGLRFDPAEQTADGIQLLIQTIQSRQPASQILLLGVFPRGALPTHPLRILNAEVNALLPGLANELGVHYLDISPKFLDQNGVLQKTIMHDFLHPTIKGYQLWAESIAPVVNRLLSPTE
ncbi:MAG: GDSL-type esterase/lipase family protein [Halioglobus sp.]